MHEASLCWLSKYIDEQVQSRGTVSIQNDHCAQMIMQASNDNTVIILTCYPEYIYTSLPKDNEALYYISA